LEEIFLTFNSEYQPFFQPPSWIIGPVWMVLYTMIAISFSIFLTKINEIDYFAIIVILFLIQLALNFTWSGVFNSANYLMSSLMILGMVIFTTIYAWLIYEHAPTASKLVWPYIAWVCFAGIINVAYYLNDITD
tara:strand:- start:431 stop:832 length:402 start_codon:yes stop_codon:yes gene_type:complete